jgi:hypothetical protein
MAPVSVPCPKCKSEDSASAKFCGECGALLQAPEPLDATLPTPPGGSAAKIDPEFGEELRVAWMQALREDAPLKISP